MASDLPYQPMWWGDYHRDTQALGMAQHGCYLLLIGECWISGCLPADREAIYRVCRASTRVERMICDTILETYFDEQPDGTWQHGRVTEDRVNALAKRERRVRAGERGGRSRWAGHRKSDSNATSSGDATSIAGQSQSQNKTGRPLTTGAQSEVPELEELITNERLHLVGARKGLNRERVATSLERFVNHHKAHGTLRVDWIAEATNWLGNEVARQRSTQYSAPRARGVQAAPQPKKVDASDMQPRGDGTFKME